MKTARDHRNSTALGRGSVGTVAATIFVSTLTLLSTEASALDINGLAAMALNCARIMADTRCTIPERRRRRDATGIRMMQTTKTPRTTIANRPALASSQHRPSAVRRSVEASATSPADTMVSLDRPLNDEAASRPAR